MASVSESRFLKTLRGETVDRPPVWLMRQAGRYLPEYRELRARTRDFVEFCYTPSIACEATLQPLRRFPFDASILFADILLILDAMGRNLRFVQNEGPQLDPLTTADELARVPASKVRGRLAPVMETVRRLKTSLPEGTPLIGFAGSPWTVGVYAIEGKGGTDKRLPRLLAYEHPEELDAVLDRLTEATIDYLADQVEAGADALMLFDSWAEGLPVSLFERAVIAPTKRIVEALRARGVTVPIIGFPRGCGALAPVYARETGVTCLALDTGQAPDFINAAVENSIVTQGHLDPLALIAGGKAMEDQTRDILAAYAGRPHVFNLGHGILPQTPPEHVATLCRMIEDSAGGVR